MVKSDKMGDLAKLFLAKAGKTFGAKEVRVLESVTNRIPISRDLSNPDVRSQFWDRLSDRVAAIGGSWSFIFTFLGVLLAWMLINTEILSVWKIAFDPYPYIFLNLMLSMTAALQAPIIMMSQNRQALRDRIAAQHDYEVNLRAELEIMALHEKWDVSRLADLDSRMEKQGQMLEQLLAKIERLDP